MMVNSNIIGSPAYPDKDQVRKFQGLTIAGARGSTLIGLAPNSDEVGKEFN